MIRFLPYGATRRAKLGALGVTLVLLAACAGGEQMMQQTTRNAAKSVTSTVISQRFPGVDVAPYTDCVIDNATDQELLNIATGAITGPDESTAQIVLGIASRPATTQCIALSAAGITLG